MSKNTQKSKRAPAPLRFETAAEVTHLYDLCVEIKPLGHRNPPPQELADEIVTTYGEDCVENDYSQDGEIEWDGKPYAFSIWAGECERNVGIDPGWRNIEPVVNREVLKKYAPVLYGNGRYDRSLAR